MNGNDKIRYTYDTAHPPKWANGSEYGPLQSDRFSYLCPDCGGYGYMLDRDSKCSFCNGKGEIGLDDTRIVDRIEDWNKAEITAK